MTALTGGRRITVHEAQVRTATVEIKSLTVSGKQVTLALFRQLIEEEIIDRETFHLCGVPWGTVNYHGNHCSHGPHIHVVWQKGTELRRAQVNEHWPDEEQREDDLRYARQVRELFVQLLVWKHIELDRRIPHIDGVFMIKLRGQMLERKFPSGLYAPADIERYAAASGGSHETKRYSYQDDKSYEQACQDAANSRRDRIQVKIESLLKDLEYPSPGPTLAQVEEIVESRIGVYNRNCALLKTDKAAWARQYTALSELEQLFIAV